MWSARGMAGRNGNDAGWIASEGDVRRVRSSETYLDVVVVVSLHDGADPNQGFEVDGFKMQ